MKLKQLFEAVHNVLLEKSQSVSMTSDMFRKALNNPDVRIGYEVEFAYEGAVSGDDEQEYDYDTLSEQYEWDEGVVQMAYREAFHSDVVEINGYRIHLSEGFLRENYEGDAYSDSIDELKDDNWDSWVDEKAKEEIENLMYLSYEGTVGEYIIDNYSEELTEKLREYADGGDEEDWDESDMEFTADNENKAHDAVYNFIDEQVDFEEMWSEDFGNIRDEFKDDNEDAFYEIYDTKMEEEIEENYPFSEFVDDNGRDIADALDIYLEPEGGTIVEVGEEIGNEIGENINVFNSYHEQTKSPDEWYIEPDSTTDYELVSAVMPADEALDKLDTIFSWMRNNDAVSTSTAEGLHVGVSIEGKKAKDYDVLKALLFLGEDYLLEQFGRQHSNWSQPQLKKFLQYLVDAMDGGRLDAKTADKMVRKSKAAQKIFHSELNRVLQGHGRAFSVEKMWDNYSADYIEFRIMGNEGYENRYEEVKNTIGRYALVLDIATSDKYNREYMTKLTRFLNKVKELSDSDMKPTDATPEAPFLRYFAKDLRDAMFFKDYQNYPPFSNAENGQIASFLVNDIRPSNFTTLMMQTGVQGLINTYNKTQIMSYIWHLFVFATVKHVNAKFYSFLNLMMQYAGIAPHEMERHVNRAEYEIEQDLDVDKTHIKARDAYRHFVQVVVQPSYARKQQQLDI